MDQRCPPWTIFNDCQNYADYISAAAALIPSDGGNAEPFWAMAARTLFVEMCVKLAASGETTNGAIAHHLMSADLKAVHAKLANTIASPLTATEAARMAESIRAVFNTNAQAIRFLPDPVPGERPPFSIRRWVQEEPVPGSILFITSTHTDLTLNRALLTLWMDLAVNALMGMPRTRDLRMWYLFDEVHALHRMPAIEHGLQTARGFGGAFVLGMHSFDKLAETYGEEGAINLASLARTKLILATADKNTAEVCSNFIGFREVRETDEAYSIGASRSRDAATITPRTEVKPLVIPDDIMNLPSLHGYVKFPEGFPAARIRLVWRDYPKIAEPFLRKTDMQLAAYAPPGEGDEEATGGDGGPAPVVGAAEQAMTEPETEQDARQENGERQPTDAIDPREMTSAEVQADTRAEGKSQTKAEDDAPANAKDAGHLRGSLRRPRSAPMREGSGPAREERARMSRRHWRSPIPAIAPTPRAADHHRGADWPVLHRSGREAWPPFGQRGS
jgi:type IV secretory pathway TraG/TraD family ATPase VirD4